MNPKFLLILAIALLLIVPDTLAGRRRRRRFRVRVRVPNVVKQWVCTTVCRTVCTYYTGQGLVCKLVCSPFCRWVIKKLGRDEPYYPALSDTPSFEVEDASSGGERFLVFMPNKMSDYDTNKDGRISLTEFKAIFPKDHTDEASVRAGFDAMDKNGDHYIDCKEFLKVRFRKSSPTKC